MSHRGLISFMEKNNIPPDQFNHFDYIDALQQLSQIDLYNHPRKRKLVQQFAVKCLQKIEEEQSRPVNKEKVNNFLMRMQLCEKMREQRIEALRFLSEKYDNKTKQLKFYPKINKRMATQRNRYWKDVDGDQCVLEQQSIRVPNASYVQERSHYSSVHQ